MLLDVSHLKTHYVTPGSLWQRQRVVRAVDDVSFAVAAGETVGLVGESGCGKSTLVRTLLGLERPQAGAIYFDGRDVTGARGQLLRWLRRHVQMVFQDPYGSLNPRLRVRSALAEVLRANFALRGKACEQRIMELLERVGLGSEHATRFPHELSGGQRQRLGIARALALEPKLLLADEPVSALDVSVQAQIINLLRDLQRQLGLAYLFIAHDLAVVEHISARVLVMYLGRIVESAPAAVLYRSPAHPYTRALLATVPIPDPDAPAPRSALNGEVPSPVNPPAGCAFHPRCPLAEVCCCQQVPELRPLPGQPEHQVACHIASRTT